jgi:hypothetical protein
MKILVSLNDRLKTYIRTNYKRFSEMDKHVRQYTSSSDEYIEHYIMRSRQSLNMVQMNLVLQADIREVDTALKTETRTINSIPWNVALLNAEVEADLPHTVGDVIFLPPSFFTLPPDVRVATLLHEKIHIFQRMFPVETNILFTEVWKLTPFSLDRNFVARNHIRFNPDNNNLVYAWWCSKTARFKFNVQTYESNANSLKNSFCAQFNADNHVHLHNNYNENQNSIYADLISQFNITQQEHPNEVMACLLVQFFLHDHHPQSASSAASSIRSKLFLISPKTVEWIDEFL